MDQEKRKWLVREIETWRRSKLLPEQYCDFLLNLYADGQTGGSRSEVAVASVRNAHWRSWLLIWLGISLTAVLILNFPRFAAPVQLGIAAVVAAFAYASGIYQRTRNYAYANISFGMGSIFLLGIGIYLLRLHEMDSFAWTSGYVVFCSLAWLLTGLAFALPVFHLCGWIGLLMCYGLFIHERFGALGWLQSQLVWLPLAILFIWAGWLFAAKHRHVGIVLLAVGALVWLVPELYSMIGGAEASAASIQISLVTKLFIGGTLLFGFRKKWTEWIV